MNPFPDDLSADLCGVWARLRVHEHTSGGDGVVHTDLPGSVWRLHAGPWFATWCWPAGAPEIRSLPLVDLSPAEWAQLSLVQASLGRMRLEDHPEGQVSHWMRHADHQPPGGVTPAGWLLQDAPDRLIEIDLHDDRSQVWERVSGSESEPSRTDEPRVFCLQGMDASGQDDGRWLMGCPGWRTLLRPRSAPWPKGMGTDMNLRDLLLQQPEGALAWLDQELSLMRQEGSAWTIVCSTLPERRGQRMPCQVKRLDEQRAMVRFSGEPQPWRVLHWSAW